MLVLQRGHQRIARALVLTHGRRAQLISGPTEETSDGFQLARDHTRRQGRGQALDKRRDRRAALDQIERRQTRFRRTNHRAELAATGGIEAETAQLEIEAHAQAAQQRREAALEKMKRRRHRVVRAATQRNAAGTTGEHQRRQHRLQHQRATARRADAEAVVTRAHVARLERQFLRAELRAVHRCAAHRHGGIDAGQVLSHQAGLRALGADAMHRHRLAGAHRQRERGAQDLAATFTGGAVEFDHVGSLLFVCLLGGAAVAGTQPCLAHAISLLDPARPAAHRDAVDPAFGHLVPPLLLLGSPNLMRAAVAQVATRSATTVPSGSLCNGE